MKVTQAIKLKYLIRFNWLGSSVKTDCSTSDLEYNVLSNFETFCHILKCLVKFCNFESNVFRFHHHCDKQWPWPPPSLTPTNSQNETTKGTICWLGYNILTVSSKERRRMFQFANLVQEYWPKLQKGEFWNLLWKFGEKLKRLWTWNFSYDCQNPPCSCSHE